MCRNRFKTKFIALLSGLCIAAAASAEDSQPTTLLLWSNGAPGALGDEPKDKPTLIIYRAEKAGSQKPTPAVVVCPGGAYHALAMGHEGHDIAQWLNSLGISAFILDYRHRGKGYGHPAPLLDAQRAIRTVRARAEEFGVDPMRIGIMGFSAGGHLASTAATHFDGGNPRADNPIDRVSCRPDFAILCYPVIVLDQEATHRGSQRNLLGDSPDAALVASLSNEKQVTAETPPTFLFHTNEDKAVPAENSVAFYLALRKHAVPTEMHIYEHGRHGVGLAPGMPGLSNWPGRCVDWMLGRGILTNTPAQTKHDAASGGHSPFHNVACPGSYRQHLQGICTDDRDAIYWSFTSELVKTDAGGKLLGKIAVQNHHGDLCFHDGKIYVAVNFGDFNNPMGNADSWVFVYDADDLSFISKHAVPEVEFGAGGIAFRGNRFFVVGGLPEQVDENYVYEYDQDIKFTEKHTIASGHTHLGIQTATFSDGHYWFGCYGGELLKTDRDFKLVGKFDFECAKGIVGLSGNAFLVTEGPCSAASGCTGEAFLADSDDKNGLVLREKTRN